MSSPETRTTIVKTPTRVALRKIRFTKFYHLYNDCKFRKEVLYIFYGEEKTTSFEIPGGLDGSSCSLPCGESVRGLFGSSLTAEPGLLACELDSSDVIGPGVSINIWPICVTWGPFELDVELTLDDSVNGFNLSISCGFEPDTGKFRRFNSTLRSLTARTTTSLIYLDNRSFSHPRSKRYSPFMSSNLPKGLKGGCSEGLLEELEGAGLGAFKLLPLMLPASLAPLLFNDNGFCAAGRMI